MTDSTFSTDWLNVPQTISSFWRRLSAMILFPVLMFPLGGELPGLRMEFSGIVHAEEPAPFPGMKSDWHGYDRYDFEIAGKPVLVVTPQSPAPGRPWVWHGEFFGHKPDPDIALLGKGFHIVSMRIPDMLGCPDAVADWNRTYAELTGRFHLARKVALVGLSRGGLYCYNWAIANPDKVACVYADAPVCDFKSWPGGKGKGPGSPRDWKLVLEKYHFHNEAEALAYDKNPIDQLEPLAKAGVPLLHVYGEADEVVPWDENTGLVAERYRKLGGEITLIAKPGVKHHPHGLEDSTPIVAFIERHASVPPHQHPIFKPVTAELTRPRQGLGNFFERLHEGGTVRVAYLGGSITAAAGWRIQTKDWLSKNYPKADVREINAAIGGTGSDLGVFRVNHDVLQHDPDLVFVEFAVNDGGRNPEEIWSSMEGIVRQTWASHPRADICFVYTFRVGYETDLQQGTCPRAAAAMELLADHYGIPSINPAKEVVAQQVAGKLIYQAPAPGPQGMLRFSEDGVHPLKEGHQLYTDVISAALRQMEPTSKPIDHAKQLAVPFVENHWESAKMVPLAAQMLTGNWQELASENPLARQFSGRMGTLWETKQPGSRLTFKFRGSTARIYDLLGPDGGQVRISVDGQPAGKPIPRFDSYCTYHRLATLTAAQNLDPDQIHTVVIELDAQQPDRSSISFRLKNPAEELKSPKYQGTCFRAGQILILGDVVP